MGSGKGNVEYYVAVVKPGKIIFEISGVSEEIAKEAMRKAGHKLPIKTKFVKRNIWALMIWENYPLGNLKIKF